MKNILPATRLSFMLEIRDTIQTYVVSMDELWSDNIEGIKHVHIADFLLMEIKFTLLMWI